MPTYQKQVFFQNFSRIKNWVLLASKGFIGGLLLFLCSLPVSASITAPSTAVSGTSFHISWTDVGHTCSTASKTYKIYETKSNGSTANYYSSDVTKFYNFIPMLPGTYNYKLYTQHCNSSGTYYTYRAEANVTVTPANQVTIITYSYDELGRVKSATDSMNGDRAYTYDDAGNRKSVTISTVGNIPPVARADSVFISPLYTSVTLHPLVNDTDPDGDTLIITSISSTSIGVASVTKNGNSLTIHGYYPSTGSFTYTISDGNGGTATAMVYVTVTAQ